MHLSATPDSPHSDPQSFTGIGSTLVISSPRRNILVLCLDGFFSLNCCIIHLSMRSAVSHWYSLSFPHQKFALPTGCAPKCHQDKKIRRHHIGHTHHDNNLNCPRGGHPCNCSPRPEQSRWFCCSCASCRSWLDEPSNHGRH